jgi:hypothetical protein
MSILPSSWVFFLSVSLVFPSRLDTFPRLLLERDDLTALNLHWVEMYMVGAKGPKA